MSGESHLRPEQAQRLFRIVQEALNNVVKHAETDRAHVILSPGDGHLLLEVRDSGKGFVLDGPAPGGAHIGLATMRERAEQLGGTLRVDSHPGQGTRVLVEIPTPVRQIGLEGAREPA
jgi:signal transduction histidine kinase